jgi:hypothetical protein
MTQPRESKIEAYLVERVEKAGGITRKMCWIGRRGCPDRFCGFPTKRYGNVELKRPGEHPDPHQEREIRRLRAVGVRVDVIDSFEAVDDYVKDMMTWP